MKRLGLLMGGLVCVLAVSVGSASAFTGGGLKPGEAPLITYGQHYTGSFTNDSTEANFVSEGGYGYHYEVGFWRLPPLAIHDLLTVNWHGLPFAHESSFPVCMSLFQNVSEFNWGETLEAAGISTSCYHGNSLSGSGTARTEITIQNESLNSSYLVFYVHAGTEHGSQGIETYPYDFSVEAPRHYLALSLGSVSKVAANGYLHASASLATGAAVPDGSLFTLTGTWSGGGVFTVGATSIAGQITFPLAMPETAFGKGVEFVATSAATSEYQAATSAKVYAEVTKPPAPPAPPKPVNLCTPATNKAHAWARIYKRRMKNAERARGRSRRRLLHDAHTAERKFVAARAAKKAAC
jgi:hypothetical protein